MTKLNAEVRARCQCGASPTQRTNASQPSPTKAERERKHAAAEAAAAEKAARRIAQEQAAAQGVDSPADTSTAELVLPWVAPDPDGWDQIPRWAGGWVLHQPPWSFGFDFQTRGTRENRRTLC